MPWGDKDKKQRKTKKGIPCKLAHKEKCMAAAFSATSVHYGRVL